jgi:iron complex transport system substrate-binding protein
MNPITVQEIVKESGFQIIRAVQPGQVFLIDEMIVSRPILRLLDGIQTISRILYPDRMNAPALKVSKNSALSDS